MGTRDIRSTTDTAPACATRSFTLAQENTTQKAESLSAHEPVGVAGSRAGKPSACANPAGSTGRFCKVRLSVTYLREAQMTEGYGLYRKAMPVKAYPTRSRSIGTGE